MATESGQEGTYRQNTAAREREAEELAAGPLLARANLLKMRGQWEEAVAVCTDALRKSPSSAPAHSLLGQIYEAQGRTDDAITWYGLALELDPHNAADRARWERLTEGQRIRLREHPTQTAVLPENRPPLRAFREKTIDRTWNFIDRLFPPGQARGIARMIYAVCAVLALLLFASAAVVYLIVTPREKAEVTPPPSVPLDAPPVVVPPPVTPTDTRNRLGTQPASPSATPTLTPSPAPTRTTPETITSSGGGAIITREVPNQGGPNDFSVSAVERTALPSEYQPPPVAGASAPSQLLMATMDVAVPVNPDWETTRARIIHAAASAAYYQFATERHIERVRVRVAVTGLVAQPAPAFYGEVSRSSLTDTDPNRLSASELLNRFAPTQWYPLPVAGAPNQ